MVTTNFRPSDSVRDIYRLLNEYNDKMNEKEDEKPETQKEDEDEDISKELANQIKLAKKESKEKSHKFMSVDTGSHNCIFIKSNTENHMELGIEIIKETFEQKIKRSKNLLRFLPIEKVTKCGIKDIIDGCGSLFDKYFLKEPTEYSIVFNRRYNHDVSRDEVIKELASLVALKNKDNKVNLNHPKLSIIVEVIKGNCCLAVLPNFIEWKKYNLAEMSATKEDENGSSGNVEETDDKKTEDTEKSEEPAAAEDETAEKPEEPEKDQ